MVTTATTLRPPSATKGGGLPRPDLSPTLSPPQAAVTLSDASGAMADLAVKVGVAKFEKVLVTSLSEEDSDSDFAEETLLGVAEFEEGREEVVEHASKTARVAAAVASEHAETGNAAFVRCFVASVPVCTPIDTTPQVPSHSRLLDRLSCAQRTLCNSAWALHLGSAPLAHCSRAMQPRRRQSRVRGCD